MIGFATILADFFKDTRVKKKKSAYTEKRGGDLDI